MIFFKNLLKLFLNFSPDVGGLVAEIVIEANDGIQGVINWQTTR